MPSRDLRLSSLQTLPPKLKGLALAAARGSMEDLDSFTQYIHSDLSWQHRHLSKLICVFYVILDPAPIPRFLANLYEAVSAADFAPMQSTVIRGLNALNGVSMLCSDEINLKERPSCAVFWDVWLRVWPWA
ncbi:hypothetical protein C8F01DRAFT_1258544 [Mycena amicta]|nr:hypothetical protein C8F01DRAFT_1258544 [Mycena amicta]